MRDLCAQRQPMPASVEELEHTLLGPAGLREKPALARVRAYLRKHIHTSEQGFIVARVESPAGYVVDYEADGVYSDFFCAGQSSDIGNTHGTAAPGKVVICGFAARSDNSSLEVQGSVASMDRASFIRWTKDANGTQALQAMHKQYVLAKMGGAITWGQSDTESSVENQRGCILISEACAGALIKPVSMVTFHAPPILIGRMDMAKVHAALCRGLWLNLDEIVYLLLCRDKSSSRAALERQDCPAILRAVWQLPENRVSSSFKTLLRGLIRATPCSSSFMQNDAGKALLKTAVESWHKGLMMLMKRAFLRGCSSTGSLLRLIPLGLAENIWERCEDDLGLGKRMLQYNYSRGCLLYYASDDE